MAPRLYQKWFLKKCILSKCSQFCAVRTIPCLSNFTSMWYKYILWAASYAGRTTKIFVVTLSVWMYVWMDDVGFSSTKKVNLCFSKENAMTDFGKLCMWVVVDIGAAHMVCCHRMRIFDTSFAYVFWLVNDKKANIQSSVLATVVMKICMWIVVRRAHGFLTVLSHNLLNGLLKFQCHFWVPLIVCF